MLERQQSFRLQDRNISQSEIFDLISNTTLENENPDDFPQADRFERVLSLCEFIKENVSVDNQEVAEFFGFSERQGAYYTAAARYLQLISTQRDKRHQHKLTTYGKNTLGLSFADRQLNYVRSMLKRPVFRDAIIFYFENGQIPNEDNAIGFMDKYGVTEYIGSSTIPRRARTVIAWIRWMESLVTDDE